ncbi:MAG: metallophosphoesterase family protein, partial [Candidatus Dormibacteraceae bacterium]
MKLLHAADLHVYSPLRGLSDYEGAPVEAIRTATRRAVVNLIDLAIDERVDAVLLAGDIYDGDWRDYNTGLFFRAQMGRLADAKIRVFLVSGNHDAASQISQKLKLPPNVYEFSKDGPETQTDEALGLAIHGQGFKFRDMKDNLAIHYPPAQSGLVNIGLLHTALSGREGHANYAPCTVNQLVASGYDYWALGHIHTREVVQTAPHIVFPGNTQGRHVRETGSKGCTLVKIGNTGQVTIESHDLSVVRWDHVKVNVSGASDLDEVCGMIRPALDEAFHRADGRLLATRVSVVGTCNAHAELWRERERLTNEVRGIANEFDQAWVEKVRPATRLAGEETLGNGADVLEAVDDLRRTAKKLRADEEVLR